MNNLQTLSRIRSMSITPIMTKLTAILVLAICLVNDRSALAESTKHKIENILQEDDVIWGFDFLPDETLIYSKRGGGLVLYNPISKKKTTVTGSPAVAAGGQGGQLDVIVHPNFTKNRLIYFTYSKRVMSGITTSLAQGTLSQHKLSNVRDLIVSRAISKNKHHFGSRIVLANGHIFVSIGDRGHRDRAQSLAYHNGKILRIREDGSIPPDNPYINRKGALPEIWSSGHRNPQGLTFDPVNKILWECEFGPKGGDEINLIRKADNYGWPIITYGEEYRGGKIGEGTRNRGMEQPAAYYTPSISPSGMTYYDGKIGAWKGNLFLANLSGSHIRRVVIKNGKAVKQEVLFSKLNDRFRHIRQGRDGWLYYSTDDGKLNRIVISDK